MPSHDDFYEEKSHAMEQDAIANASNNFWKYVGQRYIELYARHRYPVPVRPDASGITALGPFYPVTKGMNVSIQPGPIDMGINVQLEDGHTGEIGDYRIESNGNNGVGITFYYGPVPR